MGYFDRLKRPRVATVARVAVAAPTKSEQEPELSNENGVATVATVATVQAAEKEPVFEDDRITCRRCGRLAGGVCGAAKDRTLPNTGPRYAPEPERLRRCLDYVPALLEPDKRTGRERWPHGRKA